MGARCTPGIFVTGTDTGVGKSLVSAALIRVVGSHGRRTIGLKPVASGARWTPSGFCNDDALLLNATSTVRIPLELTNPYCFEPAIAPHLAAAEAGVTVTAEELEAWYERASAGADIAVVEGAGGWRTPLHPSGYLSDLPERLGLGVILVVGLRLGCLNHARLTFEAIQASRSCRFAGWVGNRIDRGFERLDANLASLERLLGCAPLAVIPPLAEASVAEVAALLDRPEVLVAVGCPD
jgi:dethiobiotin synthetase